MSQIVGKINNFHNLLKCCLEIYYFIMTIELKLEKGTTSWSFIFVSNYDIQKARPIKNV